MAEVIRMPKMSDTMEKGLISSWLKQVGDTVKAGEILAEIETDKATMELEAYEEGTLLHIGAKETTEVPINGVIAIIGEPGEDITALLETIHREPIQKETSTDQSASLTPVATMTTEKESAQPPGQHVETPANTIQPTSPLQRIFASPLAKKVAKDKGYDLASIQGTGEGGRIIKRDVENLIVSVRPDRLLPDSALPTFVGQEDYEEVPLSPMRKTIAKRLTDSKFSAPHYYLTIKVDMDKIVAARVSLNQYAPGKISFNDIFLKATATAIRQQPKVNATWLAQTIRYNKHIHLGVAVAIEEGLLVPVIRFAANKSLAHIAAEVKTLSSKAHSKQLQPKDCEGATFTISNLGMLGIESFTAIINPPSACILAIGEIQQMPVVKAGNIVPGYVMQATLSCDHRVIDGAIGAAFLKTFKELLEDPVKMLV